MMFSGLTSRCTIPAALGERIGLSSAEMAGAPAKWDFEMFFGLTSRCTTRGAGRENRTFIHKDLRYLPKGLNLWNRLTRGSSLLLLHI